MDRYRSTSRRSPPPRDRAPLRDRDNHPDVEYFGQGESYRPGGVGDGPYRPTPRERPADSWNGRDDRSRDDRSRDDRRRDDSRRDDRREDIDSYIPPTSTRAARPRSRSPPPFRRRSRSPFGRREELFPERTRSPPPRRYSPPRRDDRPRSPVRRRSRSPAYVRPRSPDVKRPRDYSPDGRRSPKRERLASPRGRFERPRSPPRRPYSPPRENNYRPRSRTPPRGGGARSAYNDDNWRRRSPSTRPSGLNSNNTSRRSSPPVHQDRVAAPAPLPRSPAYSSRNYDNQELLSYRPRSPRRDYPEKPRDPSPPQIDRDVPVAPPTGPAGYRNGGHDRPPPTGPSRPYNPPSQASPPTGPASQVSMSAHNRSGPPPTAPSRPRGGGGGGRFDGPPRDFVSPPMRGRGSLTYRAPSVRAPSFTESGGPPSGPRTTMFNGPPRGDYNGGGRGDFSARGGYAAGGYQGRGDHSSGYSATFRGSTNSSSTTYPRTQRFNNVTTPISTAQTHLATLEKIIPGGKKLPSGLPMEQERRMKMLEMEAEKMREVIREKQKGKREVVTEWEVRERESEREALRSELAEGALNKLLEGDEGTSGAAF